MAPLRLRVARILYRCDRRGFPVPERLRMWAVEVLLNAAVSRLPRGAS